MNPILLCFEYANTICQCYHVLDLFNHRSTLLASLVSVEYDKPIETFQDLLDNNILLTLTKGN